MLTGKEEGPVGSLLAGSLCWLEGEAVAGRGEVSTAAGAEKCLLSEKSATGGKRDLSGLFAEKVGTITRLLSSPLFFP